MAKLYINYLRPLQSAQLSDYTALHSERHQQTLQTLRNLARSL